MVDSERYSLSPRQVTVSTVGVIKNMIRLSNDVPHVNLALSLHAPNQQVRLKIVPTASAQKFEKLMEAVDYHIVRSKDYQRGKRQQLADVDDKTFTKRQKLCCVMIEYILIRDINDRPEHAHELGALLQSRRDYLLLNLIPYNPTDVAEDYFPPSEEDVQEFSRICQSEPYLIHTRVRQEMGQDIDGACGQLAVATNKLKKKAADIDIEDISASSTRRSRSQATDNNVTTTTTSSRRLQLLLVNLSIPIIATCLYLTRSKQWQ
jgi:adenine C2-methylase RlmN of 23S rRNA A2503 and tRNA A37